jgi:hypothetical protein
MEALLVGKKNIHVDTNRHKTKIDKKDFERR